MNARRIIIAAATLTSLLWAGTTPAVATKPNPEHKVTICHARPPDTAANGWVEITVDVASVGYKKAGHESEHDADIIPPYSYEDEDGNVFSYPGKGDQSILANGCEDPDDPTPTPTPTEDPEDPTGSLTRPTCESLFSTATVEAGDEAVTAYVFVNQKLAETLGVEAGETASVTFPVSDGDGVGLYIAPSETPADVILEVNLDCGKPPHDRSDPPSRTRTAPPPLAYTGVEAWWLAAAVVLCILLGLGLLRYARKF